MQEINGEKRNGQMLVGIGASAGGIDALLRFFEKMPVDSGLAFAVVLHTTPNHDSRLVEILQRRTMMPVTRVAEATRVERNHVYCVSPDKQTTISGGHFQLGESEVSEGSRAVSIDLFFRALAHAYKDKAIAVVLSGAGADGSLGLGRVREEGGVSIAQDPSEAEHAAMPRNAIESGWIDFILPVASMPEKLVSLKQNAERIQLPPVEQPQRGIEEDALRELLALLRARTRHDFSNYKRSTLLRRIERRLHVTESEEIRAYLDYIRRHPEELHGLLRDLLISVTNFFRDPEAFGRLESEIVPQLFKGKGAGDQIRVWVTGCATGEEAYSIAMLLTEYADTLSGPPGIQVFATDIDDAALVSGRNGVYPHTITADVSPERLKRFFAREGQYYRVKRDLRETVLFAPHNILRDPPFSKLGLVSCRNLLIYINRNVQERILEIFHFALKPDGYLFLGSSESADEPSDMFTPIDKKHRIFKRHDDGHGFKPMPPLPVSGQWTPRTPALPQLPPNDARAESITYSELHYRMLEALAPPSVLVNADYDIVHLSEHAGRYLRVSGGEPTRNLLKIVHPELRLELRSLLITAAQQGYVTSTRLTVNIEGVRHYVRVVVHPLAGPNTQAGFMLVLFEESESSIVPVGGTTEGEPAAERENSLEPIVRQLETELERTRDHLRATVEEYETSTEELKASNEELQAMNEELRSASEELETGKEELQSVNEELTTLNIELREKVEEIVRSNSDLQNLMASTRIATLFLDRSLRLKRYTPSAQELFNIIPGDVGRPLAHITHKLDYAGMAEDVDHVLRNLTPVEREVSAGEGQYFLARLLPYRTIDDKIDGVVLTFTDIHERKLAEEAVREREAQLAIELADTQKLQSINSLLFKEDNVAALYEQIVDAAISLMRSDMGSLQIFNPQRRELRLLAWKGLHPDSAAHWERITGDSRSPYDVALNAGERLIVPDINTADFLRGDDDLKPYKLSGIAALIAAPLVSRDGRVVGILSTYWPERHVPGERELRLLDVLARQAADLIEQWHAEEALRLSEERLRLVLESSTDFAIMLLDAEGRYTSWNTGAEKIFGFSEAEAVGRTAEIIFTPEDRAAGAAQEELRTADTEGRASDERWHMRKDGSRIYVSGVTMPLRDGRHQGYAKIARDLTKQMQAQEELRNAWEELDQRVQERTAELAEANSAMREEVGVRRRIERDRLDLLRRIVSTQEEERRRISRELHDQLGQSLTSLRLKIESLKAEVGKRSKLYGRISELAEVVQRLDTDVDFLAWELRPTALDDLGLIVALSNYAQEWSRHFSVEVNFHSAGLGDARLAPLVETNLYRIAQEALNNVAKHAGATSVDMLLERRNDHVILIVEDNGVGFDPDGGEAEGGVRGMGLVSMRERAALVGGSVEIESKQREGTAIFVRTPIKFVPAEGLEEDRDSLL